MNLNRTKNELDREARNLENENWKRIEEGVEKQKMRVDRLLNESEQPSEVVDARGEFDTLGNRLDAIDNDIAEKADQSEVDNINNEIGNINDAIDDVNSELDNINSEIDSINSEIDGINSEISNINNQIDDIDASLTQLKDEFDETKILVEATGSDQTIPTSSNTLLEFNSITPNGFAILDDNHIKLIKSGLYDIRLNVHFASNANGIRQIIVRGTDSAVNTRAIDSAPTRMYASHMLSVTNELVLPLSAFQSSGSNLNIVNVKCLIRKIG